MRKHLAVALVLAVIAPATPLPAAGPAQVRLPAPRMEGGKPLLEALKLRSTSRAFAPDPLPPQTLSDLLWAAWGVNRPDGRRTAPSARNWQEIDVVVVLPEAAYVYDAAGNLLRPLAAGDLRHLTGGQEFVATAPVTLVYVADTTRMKGAQPDQVQPWAFADASFISQNVYLFCASEGLATGVRAMVDRPALARALQLPDTALVVLAQSVGYPKK